MENISERLFWRRRMPDRIPVPRNRNGIWVLAERSMLGTTR